MENELTYDELVQLRQSGEIGWNDFVILGDDCDEYEAWLDDNGFAADDDNARLFLEEREAAVLKMITC